NLACRHMRLLRLQDMQQQKPLIQNPDPVGPRHIPARFHNQLVFNRFNVEISNLHPGLMLKSTRGNKGLKSRYGSVFHTKSPLCSSLYFLFFCSPRSYATSRIAPSNLFPFLTNKFMDSHPPLW